MAERKLENQKGKGDSIFFLEGGLRIRHKMNIIMISIVVNVR